MRKSLTLTLTLGLFLTALLLAPLTGARRDPRFGASTLAEINKSLNQSTQRQASQYRVTNFGVSRSVRELAAKQPRVSDPSSVEIKDREEIREELAEQRQEAKAQGGKKPFDLFDLNSKEDEREKNFKNREIIRSFDPDLKTAPDAAIAKVGDTSGARKSRTIPTPSTSFEAISSTDTGALGQGFLPPDTVGEVGPNHFVQMVNSAFRIYNRSGTPLIPLTSIGTLFGTIPGPCANNIDGDPIVLYDQLADRWILSEFCVAVANPNNHQLIAVSQTADPTGAYYLYDFMMPNIKFNDYPKLGIWSDGYYMTDNQFNQAGTQFLGAGIFAFDRSKMIAGDPTATYIYFDKAEGCPAACQFGGMLPADIDGFIPPPTGAPAPILQVDSDEFGATDSLRIFDFHADFTTPANSSRRASNPGYFTQNGFITVPTITLRGGPTAVALTKGA